MMRVELPKIFQPFGCSEMIRIGKNNDGGYLLNESDIVNSSELITLGVGEDVSFEKHFTLLHDCPITAYDGTIDNNDFFVGKHKFINENIQNSNHLRTILENKNNIFINCDIDGGEYNILNELIVQAEKITGLCIEFHGLTQYKNLNELMNFISKFDLKLIHTHINNYSYIQTDNAIIPDVIELSFSSSNNVYLNTSISLPHHLDMPNNPDGVIFETLF